MNGLSGWVALDSGIALPAVSTACGGFVPSNEAAAWYTTVIPTQENTTARIVSNLSFIWSPLKLTHPSGLLHIRFAGRFDPLCCEYSKALPALSNLSFCYRAPKTCRKQVSYSLSLWKWARVRARSVEKKEKGWG